MKTLINAASKQKYPKINNNVSVFINNYDCLSSWSASENANISKELCINYKATQVIMSNNEFNELRDLIYNISGILFADNKKYLLEGRINRRLEANYLNSVADYIKLIRSPNCKFEIDLLVDAVTINETSFFRAENQFETFEQIVVDDIINNKIKSFDRTFNIWSAASSTGEEPYTLAMIIHDKLQSKYKNIRFKIMGTDISSTCLKSAKQGLFREYAIRNMPPYYLKKYFTKIDNLYQISDEIKRMVTFNKLNLYNANEIKTMNGIDVIFCANVLIYFDFPTKEKIISSIYDSLNKGGYLFIGCSEYLHTISKAFKLVHFNKSTIYKKE